MKLIELKKTIQSFNSNDWFLENIIFNEKINIIVGKNSTGKSRLISQLEFLSLMLNSPSINGYVDTTFESCEVIFSNNKDIYQYEFQIDNEKEIPKETLFINNVQVLFRHKNEGKLYSKIREEFIEVEGEGSLLVQIRRDNKEFPYIYDIQKWSRGLILLKFIELKAVPIYLKSRWQNSYNYDIVEVIQSKDERFINNIVEELNYLGLEINNLYLKKRGELDVLYIEEKGLTKPISMFQISEGFYRTLATLILINNVLNNNEISTIIIDDLGEGLDYERATKLGKLIVEKIENSNIQFIATSNDSFLMDVIPIKYWNILQREGNIVRSLNYQNSKDLFDKFRLTGLSNFDLFSSDYLLQKQ